MKLNTEDTIIVELANKYDLPKSIIIDIVNSQFKFLKEVSAPNEKNLMLPYFGKFAIRPGRKKYWDGLNEKYGDYRKKVSKFINKNDTKET